MSYTKEEQIKIINDGFDLLKEKKKYKQSVVVAKLEKVECKTSKSTFSRILNEKYEKLDAPLVHKVFNGFTKLMEIEMAQALNEKGVWKNKENTTTSEILIEKKDSFIIGNQFHSNGRLSPLEKIQFFSVAQNEMIEFGLTLNTFSIYLNNINQNGFRKSLIELLEKGVNVKCYLLDPEWNGTKNYFNDRESIIKEELPGTDKIKASLNRLKMFYSEIKDKEFCKKFEVFTYRHFPNNYFLAIDMTSKANAKMMVSNYLFGQKRVKCPVMEFSRANDPTLFLTYKESLEAITKNSKKVNLID
jgi:hypothetical protein